MYKIMWLLKRKPGVTFEQFRDHYERSHSVLGQKYFGHLLVSYKRNYDSAKANGGDGGSTDSGFDCITEWVMPNAEAFDEIFRLLADPAIGAIFREDETHFLDPKQTKLVRCDLRDTGPGDGAEALKLAAADQ